MRKLYLIIFFCAINAFAQNKISGIGINTDTPRGTLDVNGDVRIETLDDKTRNKEFENLLATNESGKIDKISFPAVKKKVNSDVTISKLIYNADVPNNSKEGSCSNLTFKIDGNSSSPKVYMKLNNWYLSDSKNSIIVNYGVKRWGNVSGATNGYIYKNLSKTFNNTNFSIYQELDSQILNKGTILIFNIVLPGEGDLYRITASRLTNTTTNSNFAVVCEHFYKTEI